MANEPFRGQKKNKKIGQKFSGKHKISTYIFSPDLGRKEELIYGFERMDEWPSSMAVEEKKRYLWCVKCLKALKLPEKKRILLKKK